MVVVFVTVVVVFIVVLVVPVIVMQCSVQFKLVLKARTSTAVHQHPEKTTCFHNALYLLPHRQTDMNE